MSEFITNAELRIEAERLVEENEELRAKNTNLQKTAAMLSSARIDLLAENAKLREESSKYNDLYVHAIADAEVWHLQWSAEHQENAKMRELLQRLLAEYRYMSVRPRKVYMRHEERMRAIEEEMRELGVEVEG